MYRWVSSSSGSLLGCAKLSNLISKAGRLNMLNQHSLKLALLGGFFVVSAAWLMAGPVLTTTGNTGRSDLIVPGVEATPDERYVGSETCAGCHETQAKKVGNTKHGQLHTLSSWKGKVVGCETCHGPGKEHVEGGGDKSKILSFQNVDAKTASETCLACHAGKEAHNNFRRGDHWRNNIGCIQCHSGHGSDSVISTGAKGVETPLLQRSNQPLRAMLRSGETQLCMSCHNEVKAQFSKPFRHKVLEGAMNCSDCHNPHGGFESKQTKLAVGTDAACIKCHTDKQGPFAFEHGPLKLEGCTSCHTPHGSSNPKMLKRAQVRQLCFECHTGITEELTPGAPSLHNQAQVRYQQCTVCHSAIHGSNSSRYFFR